VSGSGKTTIGKEVAGRMECHFYDGMTFHPAANVAKMAAGIPLTDDDRLDGCGFAAVIQTAWQRVKAGSSLFGA